MLPIVHRELQRAARSKRFYRQRFLVGLLVFITIGLLLKAGSTAGARVYGSLSFLALLFCLLEGINRTADSISQEKREGTLGLLFLTDLRGFDIVLGKLSGAFIRSFNTFLAFVPVFAITLLLGGTTGGEFARMVLVLAATIAASLSLCLLVSTFTRQKSLGASLLCLCLMCALPYILAATLAQNYAPWIKAASPFQLLNLHTEPAYTLYPRFYWAGLGFLVLHSAVATLIPSLIISRCWQDQPVVQKFAPVSAGRRAVAVAQRNALLDQNPLMWLLFRNHSGRFLRWLSIIVGVAAAGGTILAEFSLREHFSTPRGESMLAFPGVAAILLMLAASMYVARETSRSLVEPRVNGAFELILSTPMREGDIIQGIWLGLRAAIWPSLAVITALAAYLAGGMILMHGFGRSTLWVFKSIAEGMLGLVVIGWAGMWMGLTSRTPARAFVKTILLGFFLPYIVCTPTLLNQIVLGWLASRRVHTQLRRMAAEQYQSWPGFTLTAPPPVSASTPPVLR